MGATFDVLIIPLIGGFIFVILSKIFRHRVVRHDGQYLFFLSASFGLTFLVISYFITSFLADSYPGLAEWWSNSTPFTYSGTVFGSLILALVSTIPFILMPRENVIGYIIKDEGDATEKMMWEAARKALMVCVTLVNDKVYVGFIVNPFESGFKRLNSISLIPSLSGYRNNDNNSIVFTNYYEDILEELEDNPNLYTVDKNHVLISMHINRIVSISYFDPAIYHHFNEEKARN